MDNESLPDEDGYTIEHTSRELIENKLLTALESDDGVQVAALLSVDDLDAIIDALRDTGKHKNQDLYAGFCKLRVGAFGIRK